MPPPLTPQEQSLIDDLDIKLPQTKTIDNLKQGQEEILKVIEDEREFNKSEFAKGTEKFKEISSELKEVRSEVNQMKTQISDGFNEMKSAIKNKENEELRAEIRSLKTDKEIKEDRKFTIQNGIFLIIATIILTAIFTNIKHVSFDSKSQSVISK